MINNIKIDGIRGMQKELTFGPINLIMGPNKSGKTTIADCIRFALLGYIPGMDKPPRGWAELLTPGVEEAQVILNCKGARVARFIRMNPKTRTVKIDVEDGGWSGCVDALHASTLTLDTDLFSKASGPEKAALLAAATTLEFDWQKEVPKNIEERFTTDGADKWSDWMELTLLQAKTTNGELKAQKDTYTKTVNGLESIRGIVVPETGEHKKELVRLTEENGALRQQLQELTKPKPDNTAELRKELKAINKEIDDLKFFGKYQGPETISARIAETKERVIKAERQLRDISALEVKQRADLRLMDRLEAAQISLGMEIKKVQEFFAQMRAKKVCPSCGQEIPKAKHSQAKEKAQLKALYDQLPSANESRVALQKEIDDTHEDILKGEQARTKYWEAMEALRIVMAEERGQIFWEKREALEKEIAKQSGAVMEGEEAGIEAQYRLECQIEENNQRINDLDGLIRESDYRRGQARQLAEVEDELRKVEIEAEAMKDALEILGKLRTKFTAMSLEPVLKTMEAFTKGIFDEPLRFDRGDLGRIVKTDKADRWVTFRQFSGSEQAVALAAATCALSREPSIVIVDEMGRFDGIHFDLFLKNVQEAIKRGTIKQFFGMTTPRDIYGEEVIKL